jgi:ABC-type polysaccharide/polyol phosphate transport system ATPase subunit
VSQSKPNGMDSSATRHTAITIDQISKVFRLYNSPVTRLKELAWQAVLHWLPGKRLRGRVSEGILPRATEFAALSNVSLTVLAGQTVGILGRNGSGKSTLLQIVCGTLAPSNGKVSIKGRIAALLELGSGFNGEFTGRENVYLNAQVLGLSVDHIDKLYDRIVGFADIGPHIEQPVKTYSTGMQMRLAFSVIAHIEPEVLVVDEALAVGDFVFQQKCYKRIAELKASGCTVLLVTHDLTAVSQFCDYAYVLDKGRIIASGSPNEAINAFKKNMSSNEDLATSAQLSDTQNVGADLRSMKAFYPDQLALQEYGDKKITIADWGAFDHRDQLTSVIDADEDVEIRIRLVCESDCQAPIVGYFFSDAQGREIVGTNTWYAGKPVGSLRRGDVVNLSFRQRFGLAAGPYVLNLGCSEFINGDLVAHHRLYNVAVFEVLRPYRNVGFFLPPTTIEISTTHFGGAFPA